MILMVELCFGIFPDYYTLRFDSTARNYGCYRKCYEKIDGLKGD